ncbi:DNA oxidative demethylase AlkB [Ralstonia pseudosolanacearum]|uniref:DNA oxidative demethylase AlkB n=1 Tax=Ralstonia pseudosolanacearum TaxID=1310165 RepID=UPI00035B9561|nr:DNA oxidative demethylase AlkB [Ralstonia pseudosolanacearum]ESS47297.1 alkylated DNA repair protein [Ralstonia solanacearum SD54]MCK4146021.1 DNA oxidative demethylase AlkB [Ralstonia pseudosolanacearum]BCL85843.1 alpha-ketoglutarate-dependent dioxygenase AlkB [Ralstonia solanacearum]BCM98392.1 alpha-ketoglutarate-dependent dioxygenase AlkB [Ralstonia solanacearum]
MTTRDLFADHAPADDRRIALGEAAVVLRGFALAEAPALLAAIDDIARQAPFRHMVTPGGFEMSVALTNCGALGWTSDRRGYRYAARDPQTGQPWPPLPDCFLRLARDAAAAAGFPGFTPDACLINRYVPGARLSLHQDKDERDYGALIVSVSLGMPAVFLWGGHRRTDKTQRVPLFHGDMVVWGGPDRLRYHGVLPLKEAAHPLLGAQRINLTLRRAG